MERIRQLLESYDSGALLHLYRANCAVLKDYERNAENMKKIINLMEEEIERRGLDGNLPQDSNAVQA